MAPGSGFPVKISKVADADWSYCGDEWTRKSLVKLDSSNNVSGLAQNTSFLSGSWIASDEGPDVGYASHEQSPFTPSSLMGGIQNGYHGNLEDRLSLFLQDKLCLSAPDTSALGGSKINVQSIKNQQFDLSRLEWQTISSLLPSDDEFFSSVVTDQDGTNTANFGGENEELDLFSSGGGLELDGDAQDLSRGLKKGLESLPGGGTCSSIGEHPFGEHPSRTLFVRNINSSVEDSELRTLFEQYGDIRTLYTACKHRGFVMISYYDIRAARSALRALQNKVLRRRKLDIHFSIPKDNPSDKDVNQGTLVVFNLDASVSNDDLLQIFGVYGEVKEIRETPHKRHHKFIEFYDVRSAEAALRALNRCDIAGKRIKLEPSRPGGVRKSLMQHLAHELEQEESSNASSPVITSKSSSVHDMIDNPFLENVQAIKASKSLGYSGHPASYNDWSNTFSEFGHHLVQGVQHSPSTNISTLKAQMISNHLTKMGIPDFHNMPLLQSPNRGLLPASLQTCSLESLSVTGCLGGNLNSIYRKGISPAESFSMGGFVNRSPFGAVNTDNGSSSSSYIHHHPHPVGSAPISPFLFVDQQQAIFRESFDTPLSVNSGSLGEFGRRNSMEVQFSSSLGRAMPNNMLGNGSVDHAAYPNVWLMTRELKGSTTSKAANDASSDWGGMDRGRIRKTDNPLTQHDRKQFELDIEKILRGGDTRTTLMIKNIPNKYTSKMLLAAIDEQHKGTYDFIYLPIDFKNKCNVGYAFINMTEPSKIVSFYQAFNGKRWEKFNSEKVASLAYARIQGKSALIAHFQNSSLMNEDKRCRPILFHSGGPNVGDQEAFPVGPNPRMRLGRTRGGASVNQSISVNNTSKEKTNHGFY